MRRLLVLLSWLLLLAATPAAAQVTASLVTTRDTVAPGQAFTAALRLQHQAHWHTFWQRAGTGLPTRIQWELPPGWQAGAIEWPTPTLVRNTAGEVSGYGYVGLLYLPLTITPPADAAAGTSVTLHATASWLMCKTVCVPGRARLALTVQVAAAPGAVDTAVASAIAAMSMPVTADGWELAASIDSREAILHVAAATALQTPYFYPLNAYVDYKQAQTVANRGNRALLKMALDAEESVPAADHLRGVLAYTDADGRYRGVKVDVPFVAEAVAAKIGAVSLERESAATAPVPPPGDRLEERHREHSDRKTA
ncbi:MAG TPA: protein-disulfide reductase DsbD domain-containing protein, partial [Rhodanobacteraceae bacterium]|nr:protein-disulfide reductase DsbD domain-containing protein [Rhodanobacteraceae bacterium]